MRTLLIEKSEDVNPIICQFVEISLFERTDSLEPRRITGC
jgi:hypothetical protein